MVDIKAIACEAIDAAATELHALSDSIWHHPELAYEEKHAHKILTDYLEQQGFKVKFQLGLMHIHMFVSTFFLLDIRTPDRRQSITLACFRKLCF